MRRKRSTTPAALKWIIALLILLGVGSFLLLDAGFQPGAALSYLPVPKVLKDVRIHHNGQEVKLYPGSLLTVNPRDTLQVLGAQTDGWVTWGTKLASSEVDVQAISASPVVLKTLWPNELFESPKSVDIEVFWLGRPLGKVSLSIQLDAKDWLQKAHAVENPEQKLDYLRKVLEKTPENVLVKTQMAALCFEMKRYDEAAQLYREIIETGKTQPLLERLLLTYQKQNRVDDALNVYIDLLQMTQDPDQLKQFLHYLDKAKSDTEAARFLAQHRNSLPSSFHSSIDLFLANLYTQMKDWSNAASTYDRAIKSGVKDPNILYNLAVTYQQANNPDQAIQALEHYLQKNPADIRSWMQLAGLQEKRGSVAQARATYETVLQKNPKNEEALTHLVALLERCKDKQGLESAYERLSQLQPKNRVVLTNLAVLYYEDHKFDKAADGFKAVASMDSKDTESRKYLLEIYRKLKNRDAEADMLETLIQLERNNMDYYKALFAILDDKKDYKGMASMLQKAVDQHPEAVQLHQYHLYAALKLNDKGTALKELEQLIRLQPNDKKNLKQAANLYEEQGQLPEALKKVEQILKIDSKDREAQDDYLRIKRQLLSQNKDNGKSSNQSDKKSAKQAKQDKQPKQDKQANKAESKKPNDKKTAANKDSKPQ